VLPSSWGVGGRLRLRALSIASGTAQEFKASSDISQGARYGFTFGSLTPIDRQLVATSPSDSPPDS
jgi:hypothetical protein